jgi:predicted MPP superfamily phosphohydrolase
LKITKYDLVTDKKGINIKLACVSDLHARPYEKVLNALKTISPDAILLPGDIVEISVDYLSERNQKGLEFLEKCARLAPTYYTYGNHEIYHSHAASGRSRTPDKRLEREYLNLIRSYGVIVLNDKYTDINISGQNICIGGMVCGWDKDPSYTKDTVNFEFLNKFSSVDTKYKILLCHYPHYYSEHLKGMDFDLILSGHAHGGQWRIFGRGLFAPHQGLLPKYTSGIHDGKLIISCGAVNNAKPIPRLFNPCEVIEINIKSK